MINYFDNYKANNRQKILEYFTCKLSNTFEFYSCWKLHPFLVKVIKINSNSSNSTVQVEVWTSLLSSTLPKVARQQVPKLIPPRLLVRLCEEHCLDPDEVNIQVKVEFSWK